MTQEGRNGVLKKLEPGGAYYSAEDVMQIIGCGKSKAYSIIQELRQEMFDKNLLSPCLPQGRIPRRYFEKRMYL